MLLCKALYVSLISFSLLSCISFFSSLFSSPVMMSMLMSDDCGTRMNEEKKKKKTKQVVMVEEEDTRKFATPFFFFFFFFPLTNDMNHFSRFYFPWVSSFVWVVCWFFFLSSFLFPRLFACFRARWAFVSVHFFLTGKT